jgi:uncharacterized membrane protein YgaE (UPF0421/DUF939 family)
VTHIYTLELVGLSVMVNEMGLLLIGVIIAFLVNLYMPNTENDIHDVQISVEKQIKLVLHKMSLQLINQCSVKEQLDALKKLDELITEGISKAIIYNNNYILKDFSYYVKYFQMRRQQYELLVHMEKHFKRIFVTVEHARPLSKFTEKLANELGESNNCETILEHAFGLLTFYQNSELPLTREAFENRATLFQYLNDITYFIEIKMTFMESEI